MLHSYTDLTPAHAIDIKLQYPLQEVGAECSEGKMVN